jgi:PAS domain S-box-containing protein
MDIQYTFTTAPLLIIIALLFSLAVYAWNKRQIPGAKAFILLMINLVLWSLCHLGEWIFTDPQVKLFWADTQYFFVATVPILWFIFALQITGQSRFVRSRLVLLLLIVPMTTFIGIWSNPLHGLFWKEISLGIINNASKLQTVNGPWFWVHATYSYLVLLSGTLVLLRAYLRSSHLYRQQFLLLLVGSVAPWVANAITIFDVVPAWEGLDLTPFGFFLTGLTMAWGLFRFRLLDIVPIARDLILVTMAEGVIVLNTSQQIVDINPAAQSIFNCSETDVIGKPAINVLSPWFDQVFPKERIVGIQHEIRIRQTEEDNYYVVSISPIMDRRDHHLGWVIVLRDISDRKLMEQEITQARDEAIEASKLKTRLLANVSHDLRTPLGAILGYTEILQAGVQGEINAAQYDILTDIMDSTEHLLSFVNNLIGQARLESGKMKLNIQEIHPQDLVSAYQSTANALARAKGVELHQSVDTDLPAVIMGDPYWLGQILLNLVSNAVKFTEEGSVTVEILFEDEQFWSLNVTDTGEGISEEFHDIIFEAFRQADSDAVDQDWPHGSGLGLSIVRQLAELMGGSVKLKSQLGKGSRFTVLIPWKITQGEIS